MKKKFVKDLVSVVIVSKDRKKDLIECVNSYLKSSYINLEIIVVDNASKPPLLSWLPIKYPVVKLITNHTNLGAAEGRNRGLEKSTGEYIIFTDDDAWADKDMIKNLLEAFKEKNDAGIVQPLVYDKQKPKMLQGAGYDIDLTTGRILAQGVREEDHGQYEGLREVPMCGCVWMVKRQVFDKIGNYDKEYFIPYEDCDFSIRARKAGYKLYCYSLAKTWHQGVKVSFVHPWIEWLGITSKDRAYRIARNKMIFMRKNSPFPNNLIFFFIMLPSYVVLHSLIITGSRRLDILLRYWLGLLSGTWYALTYPFRKGFLDFYSLVDEKLYPLKMILMAWTDPITWIINSKAKTILDLGCGQGEPMELIKYRMRVEKTIGVDLFEPYIKEARERQIHDKYILKDIRKLKFKSNAFDIVLASHVLEHLSKKDALNLLKSMEKWAKMQVIVATPIGEHYHPAEDGNILQLHVSAFLPEDFQKRGYKIKKYGWKWLLGDHGVVHTVKNDIIRKILYALNIIITPIYYSFQDSCDYVFVAWKDQKGNKNP